MCDFAPSTKEQLAHHISTIHQGFSYKCEKCEFANQSFLILEQHIKSAHAHGEFAFR